MALTTNLVVSLKDFPALAEALQQRQPGDKLTLEVEVVLVENLADRASFDVTEAAVGAAAEAMEAADESPLAQSVIGVMGKKK